MTPADAPDFDQKVRAMCATYQEPPIRAEDGERTVSTNELTGVQALERKCPDMPMRPGAVAQREFEYIQHGTCHYILSRDMVSGQLIAPGAGLTRTEADFLTHVQGVVASDPAIRRWHFVLDNPCYLSLRKPGALGGTQVKSGY